MTGSRGSIFDEVLVECGRSPARELVSALVETYRTHTPAIALAPDASAALAGIRDIASIAVVSDGPAVSQSRKAEALGLCSLASPIVLTELLGSEFRKPHTRAFEYVRQCRPAGLYLYIADNPLKDFRAPKQLGWITVRIRRPDGLHYSVENDGAGPDEQMSDCSRLPRFLAQLST